MDKKKRKYRWLKWIGRIFLGLFILLFLIVLVIRSPWGQNLIVSKVTEYISGKTHTEVRVEHLFITFSGNLYLQGLYLADTQGDTLVYSEALEANVPISPILLKNELNLASITWDGVVANVLRNEDSEAFNFDFLIEAFASEDSTAVEEESEPMAIEIGTIELSDFKIKYDDAYLGIDSKLSLGQLQFEANKTDLRNMRFEVGNLSLSDTDIAYRQTKAFVSEEDTVAAQLPYIEVDDLSLKKVTAVYHSIPDDILVNASVGDFETEIPKADMARNAYEVALLKLYDSDFNLKMVKKESQQVDSISTGTPEPPFEWPEYQITVYKVNFQNNSFSYLAGNEEPKTPGFNPNTVKISNFVLEGDDWTYAPKKSELHFENFSFEEQSGFHLRNLTFDARFDDTSAEISAFELKTNNSSLAADLRFKYGSVDELIDLPERTEISLNVPSIFIGLEDAFILRPELEKNPYLEKAAQKPFKGHLNTHGTINTLQIPDLKIGWGEQTSLVAKGAVDRLMQTDSLLFAIDTLQVTSARNDLTQLVSEEELGISIPESILLEAKGKGGLNDLMAEAMLKIPEGSAQLTGHFKDTQKIEFDGDLNVDSLQLDQLLNNETLGPISFTLKASGEGNDLSTLNAKVASNFTQLEYNHYDFSNLILDGEMVKGKGHVNLAFKDHNLNMAANSDIELDSVNAKVKLVLDVVGADLFALGLTKENIKAGVKVDADFSGNTKDFDLNAHVSEAMAVMGNEQYRTDGLNIAAKIDADSTHVKVDSDFLNGNLQSNAPPSQINFALQEHFKNYFETATDSVRASAIDSTQSLTGNKAVQLKMNASLKPIPLLTKVFLRGVENLDSIAVRADFDQQNKDLNAFLSVPSVTYNQSSIDSLNVLVKGDSTKLDFSAGFSDLTYNPIHVKKTILEGKFENKQLFFDFTSYDDNEKLIHIATDMTMSKDTLEFRIQPSELLFNKQQWTIPEDNSIKLSDKLLVLKNVSLSRDSQELTWRTDIVSSTQEHIAITFDNFKLENLLSLLNPDQALATGLVNGHLVVENPFIAPGMLADFEIKDLALLQTALGNLSIHATSPKVAEYDFKLAMKDGPCDLDLIGDLIASETGSQLDLDLDLNKLELSVVEGLTQGAIKNARGIISGEIEVSGTTADPQYEGEMVFDQADFTVAALNSELKITSETFYIDQAGIELDNFSINDSEDHTFTIDGSILTEELSNPGFDLSIVTEQFHVLNSTKEDNELFYGQARIDANIKINGDLNLPKVDGKINILDTTEVTYVVPEEQLDVEERDGVVIFINREDPDAILTRNDQEETSELFKGFDIQAVLEIADKAIFHVIIDEKTGDNLQVSGKGDLNLNVDPNGIINLTGRYELNSGHYETNLYNVVQRKFEINPGSAISWAGDPMDAKLDVVAVYQVETSAAPLMAAVTSSQDMSSSGKYQQVLPFLVYLNIDGVMLKPELSFDLDMPEDEQGSVGGEVYGRVQQLNEQEDELNKQVFSLLAMNRFFPDSGSDGSSGGAEALARDNINKVLSGQLNSFSNKIFGKTGFELDFDLDSFTDYQGDSPQDRTQLNINVKEKLFNDRLIVTAGSAVDIEGSAQPGQEETPVIGNVSLEYLLTESGQYRLKGFRKNEFEDIIDGQLIATGIAVILNREFNKFSQLFRPIQGKEPKGKKSKTDADQKVIDNQDDHKKDNEE